MAPNATTADLANVPRRGAREQQSQEPAMPSSSTYCHLTEYHTFLLFLTKCGAHDDAQDRKRLAMYVQLHYETAKCATNII